MTLDSMNANHPKTRLLFYAAGDVDEAARAHIKNSIERLKGSRAWVIGAPSFVDEVEQAQTPGDFDIETVGGVLEMFSALPSEALPVEIDRLHFEEVLCVVGAVAELSRDIHVPFEFELEGNHAGSVDEGVLDRTLQVGLIGEWRRHLESTGAL